MKNLVSIKLNLKNSVVPVLWLCLLATAVESAEPLSTNSQIGTSEASPGTPAINWDAYPESRALPELLKLQNGAPVKTPEEWMHQRRPELKELIQREMFGYLPAPQPFTATVTKTVPDALAGKATLKEISLKFTQLPPEAPEIRLALWIPNRHPSGKVPVFLTLNYCGNANVTTDPQTTIHTDRYCSKKEWIGQRGGQADFWCVEQVIDRGYAFATYHESDTKADKNEWTDGLFPYLKSDQVPAGSQPATIALWTWGLLRCVDQLAQESQLDPRRICLLGHSRRGKTVLFAAAMDERIALVVPHQSGTGGMALSRENNQETVERINRVFPHWFCGEFKKFGGNEPRIPFDQHAVASLVAPRLLLDTEGDQDAWANFPRSLETLRAVNPVWKLLGKTGLVGSGLITSVAEIQRGKVGELLQLRLPEKHTLTNDFWTGILNYADLMLPKSTTP